MSTKPPWQQQLQISGARIVEPPPRLRIEEPPPTIPDGKNQSHLTSIYDDPWSDEDTKSGLGGPVTQVPKQENNMAKKEPERTNLMFVYGRYRSGFNLNVVVARDRRFLGLTKTEPRYKMLNINDEFPIVIPDGNVAIIGEVYELEGRTFDFMDRLEECPDTQGREIIALDNGMRAHMYFILKSRTPYREDEIVSGDWYGWKQNQRTRKKDNKRRFLEMMTKGKADAARKREEEANKESEFLTRRTSDPSNPMNHTGRLWNPVKGMWEMVSPNSKPAYSSKKETDVTSYNGKNGKVVHVSDVEVSALRAKLLMDGVQIPESDAGVRAKIMSIYGVWYSVD